MHNVQSSRRNFLTTMALFSTAAAFGSVTRFLPVVTESSLETKWKQFCSEFKGHLTNDIPVNNDNDLLPVNGHFYKKGASIFFPDQEVLAQPTWVYWKEEGKKASDLIITFFSTKGRGEKLFRINRFELEAFMNLPEEAAQTKTFRLLQDRTQFQKNHRSKKAPLVLKTKVSKDQIVHICTIYRETEINIKKQFIHHI